MSNCKAIVFLLFIWMAGCKPTSLSFNESTHIDTTFFTNIPALANFQNIKIDSIRVYKAVLEERVVEREEVPEFKLMNTESKQVTVDYPFIGNSNHLFIFRIFSKPEKNLSVYLSVGYDSKGRCSGAGPAYLGAQRIDRFKMFSALKVDKRDSTYFLQGINKDLDLFFYATDPISRNADTFRLYQLIDNGINKIAGTKPVIYNIKKIFNDKDALLFSYNHTIVYP